MDDIQQKYGSNSNKARESAAKPTVPEKKVERVVEGEVKVKKKGFLTRFKESVISDDSASVKSYICNDVLIPSFKKALSDIITNGIDIILYGEARHTKSNNSNSRISYTKYYDREESSRYRPNRSDYSYNDIVVGSKAEAERVLDVLEELIVQYGVISVADFYEAVGVTGQYTDNNYGWKSLASARTVPVSDGWMIVLPKAMPINN